jgi:hypothetical protein
MELLLTPTSIFAIGAFFGALFGRLPTFGLLAVCFLIMLIKP